MSFLDEIFNGKSLSQSEFESAAKSAGFKVVDLSNGDYVSASKYKDELQEARKSRYGC